MLSKEVYVMKVIVVEPMKPPAVREVEDTLPEMQAVVGGPFRQSIPLMRRSRSSVMRRENFWACP